jgi:lipoate-protein ligase A
MAIDSHLLGQAATSGCVVFRTYAMSPPAVTIGRHQRWNRVVDEAACQRSGWDWSRRPTGGGALLHKNEINYAVIAPRGAIANVGEGEFRTVFDIIGRALSSALCQMGFNPELHIGDRGAVSAQHGLCGRSITGNEIALDGRKIVAAAQMITPAGILQHGTIYIKSPAASDRFWPASDTVADSEFNVERWADLGPRFHDRSWDAISIALEDEFRRHLPVVCQSAELTAEGWTAIDTIVADRIASGWDKIR